jgi:ABC-type protease/lipase transport system fused ATPase/permease subunit
VKIDKHILYIKVQTNQELIDFDLSHEAHMLEDTSEKFTVILDYRKTPILFKVCYYYHYIIFFIFIIIFIIFLAIFFF